MRRAEHAPGAGRHGRVLLPGAALALLCYLAWTAAALLAHDSLTSVADDGSNYLVMALHFSPWRPETEAVRAVWAAQYFPPLFPLLLAATGAVHSLLAAHLLVCATGLAALVLLGRYAQVVFETGCSRSVGLALGFASMPGFLLGLQGVLSESLYLVLSLLLLMQLERKDAPLWPQVLLLAAVLFTRSAGWVLVPALLACVVVGYARTGMLARGRVAVVLGALLCYWLAMHFVGPPGQGEYGSIWSDLLGRDWLADSGRTSAYLASQGRALVDAWCAFLLVYWLPGQPALLLALLIGALGLCGLFMRLRENRLDAWYVAGSLAMLLVWPYPGQLFRLLFPVVPLLLLQAAWCVLRMLGARADARWVGPVAAALLAAVALPPHAFLHARMTLAREMQRPPIYEWLRKPAAEAARRDLGLQTRMLADFARVRASVPAGSTVAYYEPSYVALLSDRPALRIGLLKHRDDVPMQAEFLMLTRIHPRMNREGIDGLAVGDEVLADWSVLWCSVDPLTGLQASCLYRRPARHG